MTMELVLAQDLCARLCHDLVGPLGTVGGAMALLEEEPDAAELAQEAAGVLRRRLEFWRAACGAGTGPLDLATLGTLVEGVLAGGRARLDSSALPPDRVLPAPVAQLVLVAAMLAAEGLPRGGVVRLAPEGGEALALRLDGAQAAWPPALAASLQGQAGAGPRAVLGAMLPRLAGLAGWTAGLVPGAEPPALVLSPLG
jgi:histidine phosphotransferase ChpT